MIGLMVRENLDPKNRSLWAEAAVRTAAQVFAYDSQNPATWSTCSMLLPHVLAAAAYAQTYDVAPACVAGVLDLAGSFLHRQAQYAEAQAVLESALELNRRTFGDRE